MSPQELARASATAVSAAESAEMAGLRYVSDRAPGFRRRRAGRGFTYLDVGGAPIRERRVLRRIKALVIPPAWRTSDLSAAQRPHQASARDAKDASSTAITRWREIRDEKVRPHGRVRRGPHGATVARGSRPGPNGSPRNKLLATVEVAPS